MYSEQQIAGWKNIKILTVRDTYAQNLVKEATGREARLVVDPTLLIDWIPVIEKKVSDVKLTEESYMLVYGGVSKEIALSLKQYAGEKKLKLINIGTYNRHFEINVAVSPFEYLYYINNASCIVTSMFHGVMLSLALHKKFRYISMDVNRDKKIATSMEILLGLTEEKSWKWNSEKSGLDFTDEIDYVAFESKREAQAEISKGLMKEMIG